MQLTLEQQDALDLFTAGLNVGIQAGAGTGKTTTLQALAGSTPRRGQYLAFNRSIVTEASRKMPGTLECRTVHSVAMKSVGRLFRHRLDTPRMGSERLARLLDIEPIVVDYGGEAKVMRPGFMAGHVMRAIRNFSYSADPVPNGAHFDYIKGIDMPDASLTPRWENNVKVRQHLAPALEKAWADIANPDGRLPFAHDHYLKIWELGDPQMTKDYVMIDESQDLSPVMLSIATKQRDTQLVFVGDSQQSIYAWRGAVDALDHVGVDAISMLTQSFRFGPRIADLANLVLGRLGAPLRLVGNPAIDSVVAPLVSPAAILTRTNAVSVSTLFEYQRQGVRAHLIGGGEEVARFARGARELMLYRTTDYRDLACFSSWTQVQEYAAQDPQGDELKLLVDLVDEFKVDPILKALENMPDESIARVVVSTAHKAKGREWPSVQLTGDFLNPAEGKSGADEEWRLLYVALTRAQYHLDIEGCEALRSLLPNGIRPAIPLGRVQQ